MLFSQYDKIRMSNGGQETGDNVEEVSKAAGAQADRISRYPETVAEYLSKLCSTFV
jgi:hypothetical protein